MDEREIDDDCGDRKDETTVEAEYLVLEKDLHAARDEEADRGQEY